MADQRDVRRIALSLPHTIEEEDRFAVRDVVVGALLALFQQVLARIAVVRVVGDDVDRCSLRGGGDEAAE